MTLIQLVVFSSVGLLIFEVLFIRIGFLFGATIGNFTLIFSFLLYCSGLFYFYSISTEKKGKYLSLLYFIGLCLIIFYFSFLLGTTYDTSWDGQGYHQTAVSALANGWNPLLEPTIHFDQELPSQIFAEGYPSALWEIEASIYSLVGKINAAKVITLYIAVISGMLVYILLRTLTLNKFLSVVTSLLIVIQPVYVIQFFSFMQDGVGYELIVMAITSLILYIISSKSQWAMGVFLLVEVLLVSTKYSHLPAALMFGIIFLVVFLNRVLNKDFLFTLQTKLLLMLFVFIAFVFASLPYIRNGLFHGSLFYPTNIPNLMGSVTYNNVPNNLNNKDKFSLLFYGLFSRAQAAESGDPRSKTNIAELKVPFSFSVDELTDSASLHNNRVGAGGPLFSGIVLLSLLFLIVLSFKTTTREERYAVYISYFCLTVVLLLALLAPTPNLLRYVNQLQLLPFVIIIPLVVVFRNRYVQGFLYLALCLVFINTLLYSSAVLHKYADDTNRMNKQFADMRASGEIFEVRAQQFYSNYILLHEQNIPFVVVDNLHCKDSKQLVASSTTTQFCVFQK